MNCSGCNHLKPQEFCWDARDLDCPLGMPPRSVTGSSATLQLWRNQRWMAERLGLI